APGARAQRPAERGDDPRRGPGRRWAPGRPHGRSPGEPLPARRPLARVELDEPAVPPERRTRSLPPQPLHRLETDGPDAEHAGVRRGQPGSLHRASADDEYTAA